MSQKKIFVLTSQIVNPWYSCRVIEEGMIQALRAVDVFEICPILDQVSESLLQRIRTEASSLVIVSTPLLSLVADQIEQVPTVPLVIPIFGDMTIETRLWTRLDHSFKGRVITFLGASTRQCQQLQRFIKGASIKRLPYPLPESWFAPLTEQTYEKLKLVYSGRITQQKNVLELMLCFLKALQLRPEMELHIAGDFHDLGHHFHGIFHEPKFYELRFFDLVQKSQGKIVYHGFLSQTELKRLYESSEYFVSLSTYHDEDFGVSVAQGIACGMRAVLTDWGGYADFAELGVAQLCKVEVDQDNVPRPVQSSVVKALLALPNNTTHTQRCANQNKLNSYINQTSYSAKLLELATSSAQIYEGQKPLFQDYSVRSEKQYVFSKDHGEKSHKMYHDIYESYLVTESDKSTWR